MPPGWSLRPRGAEYARAALSTCHAGSSACCPFRLFLPFRVWRLLVEPDTRYLGGSRVRRGRALSRGQATARPSPQAVSAHWVTIAPPRIRRQSKLPYANNQDWSHCRCMLHRGSRINLYPVERQWLVPKSCILVAARLQDGWDSSLVRLIRPTRHPHTILHP
jgi:hypothetical protein